MYVIKLKNEDLYLDRDNFVLVDINNTITYKNELGAKLAFKAASKLRNGLTVIYHNNTKFEVDMKTNFEIREVEINLKN